jgi:DNA-directed RNA polymerase subunit RPC12/RpoP
MEGAMLCSKCNREFPSQYYFVTDSVCIECFHKMPMEEQHQIVDDIRHRTSEGAASRTIKGKSLKCPVCGHKEFWKRRTLMNTPGMTFFGVEWANKQADNLVCDSCGYIFWFMVE